MDWIRSQKEIWQNNKPWDRRAVIWSAVSLSHDEKSAWLNRVMGAGDVLDKVVAKAAKKQKILGQI